MSIVTKPHTFSAGGTIIASEHNSNFDTLYNLVNGNLDTSNLSPTSLIAMSQLSFSTPVTHTSTWTQSGGIMKWAKGADVASAAGTITLDEDGNFFDITGTEAITSITAKTAGTWVALQFDSTASLVDGGNLKLNGNFTGAAESTIILVSDGTNWYELSRCPVTSNTMATQAEQETATSTTTIVSPGRQQYHPSAAKAWCMFNGTTTGTNAPSAGYNVTSVTRNGTGDYTINLTTSFSGTSYGVFGNVINTTAGSANIICIKNGTTLSTGSFRITAQRTDTGALVDSTIISVSAFGDQ